MTFYKLTVLPKIKKNKNLAKLLVFQRKGYIFNEGCLKENVA